MKHERRTGTTPIDVTHVYDPAGNRTLQIDFGTRTTYTHDAANQLTLAETGSARTTYLYDDCGNRTRKETPEEIMYYTWDEVNRMTVAEPVTGAVTMVYDADGRRVRKDSPTEVRKFLYDFEKVLQESDDGKVVHVRRAKVRGSSRCKSCPGKGRPGRVAISAVAEVTKRLKPGRQKAALEWMRHMTNVFCSQFADGPVPAPTNPVLPLAP